MWRQYLLNPKYDQFRTVAWDNEVQKYVHNIPSMRTYLIFSAAILREWGENNWCPDFWLEVSVA